MAREHQRLVHQPTTLVGPQDTRLVSCPQHRSLSAWLIHMKALAHKCQELWGCHRWDAGSQCGGGYALAHRLMQAVSDAQVCVC